MGQSVLDRFWEIIGGVFLFQGEVFQRIVRSPDGLILAMAIVLGAGLSLTIGEAIVLFINRVKPLRFLLSLLIGAVLYLAGYIFLVLSTWAIGFLPGTAKLELIPLIGVFGLSFSPLLFSFLGALPYFGVPILSILSIWHLLAMVVGIAATAGVTLKTAFVSVSLGWIALQVLQRTAGQPIAALGKLLFDRVAGVNIVRDREDLSRLIAEELIRPPSPIRTSESIDIVAGKNSATGEREKIKGIRPKLGFILLPLLGILGVILLTALIYITLDPLRNWGFQSPTFLSRTVRFGLDLFWIGILALAVAGFLAPLETLGWWAGWYNDEIDTTINTGTLANAELPDRINRYLIYLDGIGQSSFKYLPDVEIFLDALTPALPEDTVLIRGIMTYSVLNNPLNEDRPLSFFWRLADRFRFANPSSLLGMMVNLRNVLIVAVSADARYGPIYRRGIAQILYNALIKAGYRPGSGVPVSLIGYSGGGQMAAATAGVLKNALGASIDVISLGGVISGNCNLLEVEHLYHLVGDRDGVEKIGPIMFPGRWKIFPLSYWNRAARRGKITLVSLGPAGHQVPGGLMDPDAYLPDGRSFLEQTIDYIQEILEGQPLAPTHRIETQPSNYRLYKQAAFNHPDYYPTIQSVGEEYRPIAPWMGRLILPRLEERYRVRGVRFEVYHAPPEQSHLVGKTVKLRYADSPSLQKMIAAVTRDLHFSADAEYTSTYGGLIHPERLDHRRSVNPLESLAGSRPEDDVIVLLFDPVIVETVGEDTVLKIYREPSQISGRYYALIRFLGRVPGTDSFEVVHFNRESRDFDGRRERVRLPDALPDRFGCFPSSSKNIERSPLNESGWYIYGAKDRDGNFVIRSLIPRSLWRLQPDKVIFNKREAYRYIRKETWANIEAKKGTIGSVLLSPGSEKDDIGGAIDSWREGDRALLVHTYGGIGGKKKEPAANGPVFFGHFAYGIAKVIRDPLTDELRFDVHYHQVYTHNTDGIIAGTLHASCYLGDRQFGWMGTRPVRDILIKYEPFTGFFQFDNYRVSPLTFIRTQLEAMTARYRIGDGTGGTYVGAANNCAQDSNQALFASIRMLKQILDNNQESLEVWAAKNPRQADNYYRLLKLDAALHRDLQPLEFARRDWTENEFNLGTTLEDRPLRNLITGLTSWRTLLPRLASDTVVDTFLARSASIWVLGTDQVGGEDEDISPIAPFTF